MNKFSQFSSILLLTALFACSKTAPTNPALRINLEKCRSNVTLADVYSYVETNNTHPNTKAADVRIEPIVSKNDTVMYLVNYPQGWELLSGVRKASKVLIKCDSGNITYEDLKMNPSASDFMDQMEKSLSLAMHDNSFRGSELFNDTWDGNRSWPGGGGPGLLDSLYTAVLVDSSLVNLQTRSVGPLLSTNWGQDSLWNCSMPYMDSTLTKHCLCGCTPVAAGQVLYYLNQHFNSYPAVYSSAECNKYIPTNEIGISLSSGDVAFYGLSSSNWSNMALNIWSSSGFDEVSALLLDLGIKYHAGYKRNGTGANILESPNAFPSYGYTCQYTEVYNNYESYIPLLESNIYDASLPIILGVVDPNPHKGGHTVVLDGYKYCQNQTIYQYDYYDSLGNYVTTRNQFGPISESRFVTINWGSRIIPNDTIWYNFFDDWINGIYNYSIKREVAHDFDLVSLE